MRVPTSIAVIAILGAGLLLAGGIWLGLRADRPQSSSVARQTGLGPGMSMGAPMMGGGFGSMGQAGPPQGFAGPPGWGAPPQGAPSAPGGTGGPQGSMSMPPWSAGGGPPGGGFPGGAPGSMGGPGGAAPTPKAPGPPSAGAPGGAWPTWGQGPSGPPKAPSGSAAPKTKSGSSSPGPAPSPWPGWGQGTAGPPQMASGFGAPGMWPGGSFGGPAAFGGPWGGGAPTPGASADPASKALNQIRDQLALLASAAEDLEDASLAIREKNQDQVKEILHRGAERLRKVSDAWRKATNQLGRGQPSPPGGGPTWSPWGPWGGPSATASAASPQSGPPGSWVLPAPPGGQATTDQGPSRPGGEPQFALAGGAGGEQTARPWSLADYKPIPVPTDEPTAPGERAALEEAVRTQLRLLQAPYAQLVQSGADVREVREALRSCRDTVNRGALREAALSLNAAAELIGRLLTPNAPPSGRTAPAP